ncbi:hypothetical protein Pssp01_23000 [Pseudomonas sp. NBRC 100443]|nr:hypothetical protein Pssp01_23000 [Pseudomonas sp. NBRC 100443]
MRQKASVRRSVKPGRACGYKARGNLFDGRTGEGWVGFSWEREDAWPFPFGAFGGAGKSRLFASKLAPTKSPRSTALALVGASLLAKGIPRWLRCLGSAPPLSLTLSLKGEGTVGQGWMFWRQPATPNIAD